MRRYFLILAYSCLPAVLLAQLPNGSVFFDETASLSVEASTSVIADVTANKGKCLYRSSSSNYGTMFFGPYVNLPAGNYVASFRLKVGANTSSSTIIKIDVVTYAGGVTHGYIDLKPNMFKQNNTWEIISFPFLLPDAAGGVEVRGMGFQPGVTDLCLDYVEIRIGAMVGGYSEQLTLESNGNVGIGTAIPKEKLSVNGKIRAHEVKVETANWPDYVFEEGYQPKTLKEIDEFVKLNKHLPDVPSAKVVAENGIELGEMNKILLKKIEELTLYLIAKDKAYDELLKRIEKLEKDK